MNKGDSISPLDGRYKKIIEPLYYFFSEKNIIKTKIDIENKYLRFILNLLNPVTVNTIKIIEPGKNFFEDVIKIESETNHDIKAIERCICE